MIFYKRYLKKAAWIVRAGYGRVSRAVLCEWYNLTGLLGFGDADQRAVLDWKDRYLGASCAIIGNGPSLRAEDLENLQARGVTCFASNKIYKIYKNTFWRPDFYACTDQQVFSQNRTEILKYIDCPVFLRHDFRAWCERERNGNLIREKELYFLKYFYQKRRMKFYPDCRVVLSGGSVTYVLIQLAWMMGFREIFLIGCDHEYHGFAGKTAGKLTRASGEYQDDYFDKNYIRPGEILTVGSLDRAEKGYLVARDYIEKHGGHIYNATRGGRLDALERINPDALFQYYDYDNGAAKTERQFPGDTPDGQVRRYESIDFSRQ